ncbi:hypothetical protein Tco_0396100, partial [Tanacetum coccineum]
KNTSIGARDVGFGRGKQANEGSQGQLRRKLANILLSGLLNWQELATPELQSADGLNLWVKILSCSS